MDMTHVKVMYDEEMTRLRGHKKTSTLDSLVKKKAKQGEAVFLDNYEPLDDASRTALSAASEQYPDEFAKLSTPAFADYLKVRTPHMAVNLGRVMVTPEQVEFGHSFNKHQKVQGNTSEEMTVLSSAHSKLASQKDAIIFDALFAASKQAGKDAANLSTVTFPASQQINLPAANYADVTIDVFDQVEEIIGNNYDNTEESNIFMVISPTFKRHLKKNSRGTLSNADFIEKKNIHTGDLPDINGIHVIVDKQVKNYKGTYDDAFIVFATDAITLNCFQALSMDIGPDSGERFVNKLYMEELLGAVRTDDKGVIQGTVGTA